MRIARKRFVFGAGAALCAATPAAAKSKAEPIPGCTPPPGSGTPGPPRKIMLIRHAEKPTATDTGVDGEGATDANGLRVKGWERAGALAQFFAAPKTAGIATPTALFAGAYVRVKRGVVLDDTKSLRPYETLLPLSVKLNLGINTCFPTADIAGLAATLLKTGGTILVAWEHKHIPLIVAALPVLNPRDVPTTWPGERYDIVFVLDLVAGGTHYNFTQVPELLLAGDSATPFPTG